MKKIQMAFYAMAAIIAIYAIVVLVVNISAYSAYVSYYGFSQVFIAVAGPLFECLPWAFVLFAIGYAFGYIEKRDALRMSFIAAKNGDVADGEPEAIEDEPEVAAEELVAAQESDEVVVSE